MKKGIHFPKIGAKIIETFQPLDLGPYFKILKSSERNTTDVGTTSVMSRVVDQIFKQLRIGEEVVLRHGKLNALKGAVICATE